MTFGRQPIQQDPPRVIVHPDVIERSRAEIAANPRDEVGGKLVGYLIESSSQGQRFWPGRQRGGTSHKPDRATLLVLGSLSSGPRTERSPVELVPDGTFQAAVFQDLVAQDREIEHLGTWHSHHPNGLRQFSPGDRHHYQSLVRDPNYNLDLYLAMLAVESTGLGVPAAVEIYRRQAPSHPWVIAPTELLVSSEIPSLQPSIDRLEHSRMEGPPRLRSPDLAVAEAMDRGLRRSFPSVSGAIRQADSISWTISGSGRGGTELAAVTYPGGESTSSALSLTVSSDSASITVDASMNSDIHELLLHVDQTLKQLRDAVVNRDHA